MHHVLHVFYAPTPHQEPGRPARERVQAQSAAARVVLDLARRNAGAPGAEEWTFEKTPKGAPAAHGAWNWSLSHDAHFVAAAVYQAPVGIDLERLAARRIALVNRVLNRAEQGLFDCEDEEMFMRAWTAKESVLKSAGVGLAELSQCRVVAVPGPESLFLLHRERVRLVRQTQVDGHVLSAHLALPDARMDWTVRWVPTPMPYVAPPEA